MLICLIVSTVILFGGRMKRKWKEMKITFGLPVLLCKYFHATLDTSENNKSLTGSIDDLLGIPDVCWFSQVVSLSREFVCNTLHWPWNHIEHYLPFPTNHNNVQEAGFNTPNASLPDSSVTWIQFVLPIWCPPVHSPCWNRAAYPALFPASIHEQSWDVMAGNWGSELPQAAEGAQTLTQLHPASTWWAELHCAWAFLAPAHPVKQCLCFVFPQEDACHCLCGMEQMLLQPLFRLLTLAWYCNELCTSVVGGPLWPWPYIIPVPLGWLGLSTGAEKNS